MKKQEIIIRDTTTRDRVLTLVGNLNIEKPWCVTVQHYRKKRSLSQNALYWSWVDIAAEYVGEYREEMHDLLKRRLIPDEGRRHITIADEHVETCSTKRLNTAQFSDYMTRVDRFLSAELGLLLPHPEDMQRH